MFDLVISFPTAEHREFFVDWLCNQSEQDYWDCASYDPENRPVVNFDYWQGTGKGKSFVGNSDEPSVTITTTPIKLE